MTKMHLPPIEKPPERGGWGGFILLTLVFAASVAAAAYTFL